MTMMLHAGHSGSRYLFDIEEGGGEVPPPILMKIKVKSEIERRTEAHGGKEKIILRQQRSFAFRNKHTGYFEEVESP